MLASMRVRAAGTRAALLAISVGLIAPLVLLATLSTPGAEAQEIKKYYFEDSGQTLSGAFLESWLDLGGMAWLGKPVTPPVQFGERWVQWFEYARLELNGAPLDEATAEHVTKAPVGRFYAEKFGYISSHPAFQPVEGAGEGVRYFEETGHFVANGFLIAYEANNTEERLGKPISREFKLRGKTYQFFEYGALYWTEEEGAVPVPMGYLDAVLEGRPVQPQEMPEGATVYTPNIFSSYRALYPGERWIEIDLSDYVLIAWEGNEKVLSSLVVTGAPLTPTVTGEFRVNWKLESQTMEGAGPDGIEYRQEDVPWVMYFYQDWAIHGAYWRYSFGYAASHGCVNLPVDVSRQLYDWAPMGTRVVVHE